MKSFNYILSAVLLAAFCLLTVTETKAQGRVDYRQLAMKDQHPPLFFDFFVLPDQDKSSVTFASVFSLSYKYLPFRKDHSSSQGDSFSATADLNIEVFKSDESALGKKKGLTIKGLESAGRAFWSDTAYAKSYEQSQSLDHFLSGQLSLSLKPGIYNYVLQMNRGSKNNNRLSRVRSIKIESFDKMETGNIILGDNVLNPSSKTPDLKLIALGDRVRYGKDFYALIFIPSYKPQSTYKLTVTKLEVADKDTSQTGQVYSTELSNQNIKTEIIPKLKSGHKSGVLLSLAPSPDGYTYALAKIPNSTFPNAIYRLAVETDNKITAKGVFRSAWLDMPRSLLSLDVSIDMLHFIIDKQTVKNISSGSKAEREKKFRAFWKERDPTPKTEFNELMAEYYRRVDYAYDHFSGSETPGYDTDQGSVYIKYGPPKNIERKFPATGPAVEIWTYPSREFIFKATSGFGDFRLTNKKDK